MDHSERRRARCDAAVTVGGQGGAATAAVDAARRCVAGAAAKGAAAWLASRYGAACCGDGAAGGSVHLRGGRGVAELVRRVPSKAYCQGQEPAKGQGLVAREGVVASQRQARYERRAGGCDGGRAGGCDGGRRRGCGQWRRRWCKAAP